MQRWQGVLESNTWTDSKWVEFKAHRVHVTNLLEELHQRVVHVSGARLPWEPHGTLCLLGAGNCNDVDLRRLLRRFQTIELVDIDADALARGISRQLSSAAATQRIKLHGSVDLFGVPYDEGTYEVEIDSSSSSRTSESHYERVAAELSRGSAAATLSTLLSRRCDVVGATGLLPMLVVQLQRYLGLTQIPVGERAMGGWDMALDVLCESYLRGLIAAVRPGGTVAHVSTLVFRSAALSNETFSETDVLLEYIERGNFFPATNPYSWITMDGGGTLHSAALWPGRRGKKHGAYDSEGYLDRDSRPYWVWRSSLAYAVTWLAL